MFFAWLGIAFVIGLAIGFVLGWMAVLRACPFCGRRWCDVAATNHDQDKANEIFHRQDPLVAKLEKEGRDKYPF